MPEPQTDPTVLGPNGRVARAARVALMALAGVLAMFDPVHARASATVPEHVRKYLSDARIAGPGRLTWFGFHVYDAHLYAPRGFDARTPFARPFVLELEYARKLEGRAIADASRDEIVRMGFGSEDERARWHQQMAALFPDVDKQRRLAGVHLPDKGARFYFDGRFIGAIEDVEFARAFFSIWLDPRTRAPRLRDGLLRQLETSQ